MRKSRSLVEHVFSWIQIPLDSEGCWKWTGSKNKKGYGRLCRYDNGKSHSLIAHRVVYELFYGPIPSGMCVCHDCPGGDNPWCINPKHLWLGTNRENTHDAIYKGRGWWQKPNRPKKLVSEATRQKLSLKNRGSLSPRAKLTEDQVKEIIHNYTTGQFRYCDLAGKYNCSATTIGLILNGRIWRHVSAEIPLPNIASIEQIHALARRLSKPPSTSKPPRVPKLPKPSDPDWRQRISARHRGSGNSHAKLTEEKVSILRQDWHDGKGLSMMELALKYGVSWSAISHIIKGRTWRHIP